MVCLSEDPISIEHRATRRTSTSSGRHSLSLNAHAPLASVATKMSCRNNSGTQLTAREEFAMINPRLPPQASHVSRHSTGPPQRYHRATPSAARPGSSALSLEGSGNRRTCGRTACRASSSRPPLGLSAKRGGTTAQAGRGCPAHKVDKKQHRHGTAETDQARSGMLHRLVSATNKTQQVVLIIVGLVARGRGERRCTPCPTRGAVIRVERCAANPTRAANNLHHNCHVLRSYPLRNRCWCSTLTCTMPNEKIARSLFGVRCPRGPPNTLDERALNEACQWI